MARIFYSAFAFVLLLTSQFAFAVVIGPNTIINTPTVISNDTVDLTAGNFIVQDGASLKIENCNIVATMSGTNPNLISVELGSLDLTNNEFVIDAATIPSMPGTEASFYALRMGRVSALNLSGNHFKVLQQFKVGLLTTSLILPIQNITVSNNTFESFHGVLYLLNSFNSTVSDNLFKINSSGQVVLVGRQSTIAKNSFIFSGINELGNAMDIVDSEDVTISKNILFTPTSQGIAIILSDNVTVDGNTITGGITYAMNLLSNSAFAKPKAHVRRILAGLKKKGLKHHFTNNITITNNYMSQNRYGITAIDVNNLTVTGNYFTQKFPDAATRKFWTNNDNIMSNITGLTWDNNWYKEAFTQINKGDNSLTQNIVPFPASGGVVL